MTEPKGLTCNINILTADLPLYSRLMCPNYSCLVLKTSENQATFGGL